MALFSSPFSNFNPFTSIARRCHNAFLRRDDDSFSRLFVFLMQLRRGHMTNLRSIFSGELADDCREIVRKWRNYASLGDEKIKIHNSDPRGPRGTDSLCGAARK